MKFAAGNAQHIGAREEQQDSFGFSDPSDAEFVRHGGFLGIVADGMGGLAQGDVASSMAVKSFLSAYQSKAPEESIVDALSRSLAEANRAVLGLSNGGSSADTGTTLVAAVVLKEQLYWISAGDSRIYWIHNGELTQLTADHIYATRLDREVARGILSRADARAHPDRATLTSYLGQEQPALADRNLKPILLHDKDSVLLCSDGFYRGLSETEIVSYFRKDPQHACDELVQLVIKKDRKQQDNLTVIALTSHGGTASRGLRAIPMRYVLLVLLCAALLSGVAGFLFQRWHVAAKKQTQSPLPVTVSRPGAVSPAVQATPPSSAVQPNVNSAPIPVNPKESPGPNNPKVPPTRKPASGKTQKTSGPAGRSVHDAHSPASAPGQPGQASGHDQKPYAPPDVPKTTDHTSTATPTPPPATPAPPTSGPPPTQSAPPDQQAPVQQPKPQSPPERNAGRRSLDKQWMAIRTAAPLSYRTGGDRSSWHS
jgi:PPM family protein phosphatase